MNILNIKQGSKTNFIFRAPSIHINNISIQMPQVIMFQRQANYSVKVCTMQHGNLYNVYCIV